MIRSVDGAFDLTIVKENHVRRLRRHLARNSSEEGFGLTADVHLLVVQFSIDSALGGDEGIQLVQRLSRGRRDKA